VGEGLIGINIEQKLRYFSILLLIVLIMNIILFRVFFLHRSFNFHIHYSKIEFFESKHVYHCAYWLYCDPRHRDTHIPIVHMQE